MTLEWDWADMANGAYPDFMTTDGMPSQ
jgi:hypothetical protein